VITVHNLMNKWQHVLLLIESNKCNCHFSDTAFQRVHITCNNVYAYWHISSCDIGK